MWSSIANLKENLNKIALDVHDDDDEDHEIYGSRNGGDFSGSGQRNSNGVVYSRSFPRSPVANGFDSPLNSEIEQHKAEIKRLRESEAEIKALSVNYAALLKEKEDQISRLKQENGSLKRNLNTTNAALKEARSELTKASNDIANVLKGTSDQSPNRLHKSASISKNRNQMYNGVASKQDGIVSDSNSQGREKELADLLEESNKALAAVQATLELQRKEFKMELEKEHEKLANIQLKLQEEQRRNQSFKEELKSLRLDKEKTSLEMGKLRNELDSKVGEIRSLQAKLNRQANVDAESAVVNLKEVITSLEEENNMLKLKQSELEAALEMNRKSINHKVFPDATESSMKHPNNLKEEAPESFPGKEEMELSLQRLDNELKETRRERDKAQQELKRLKQHLLEKESEESEKMDEDNRIIEELSQRNEYQKAQILHLEKALKQAVAVQEEIKMINNGEIQKSKETNEDLNKKLANCLRTVDAKNVELLNLQTALGQYYAEIEAKEHLERELALAREESIKLSNHLKDADEKSESSKRENEEIMSKLLQAETMVVEWKNRGNKLEEDNAKVRRVLEQSMTRLNRMSVDSDFLVDRRIVIKLLVTYFQRNHSKEVLDLMVRMLGFSEEDKQRIGVAQQTEGGKGVVRGVLGLPGRLVGGILGGASPDTHASMALDNQSFADLWVDFLLKETEERERRDAEDASKSKLESKARSSNTAATDNRASSSGPGFSTANFYVPSQNQNSIPLPSRGSSQSFEHSDSEFSTVPLTSSDSNPRISRLLPY